MDALPLLDGHFELRRDRTAAAQIHEYLRNKIVKLEFRPGTVLPRPELAEFFHSSVTPIRDALLRLEEEGLVDIFPQHGTRVKTINVDSARHAHFLRLTLELEVARTLAAKASDSEGLVAHLRDLIGRQRVSGERKDWESFVSIDQEFHRAMFDAVHMGRLWQTIRDRSGNMDRLRRLHVPLNNKAEDVLQEHENLVQAIETGDPAKAEARVREHLGGTLSKLIELQQIYPEYLIDPPNRDYGSRK